MSGEEVDAFREAVVELWERVSEVLADGSELTSEEIESIVEELETGGEFESMEE